MVRELVSGTIQKEESPLIDKVPQVLRHRIKLKLVASLNNKKT